MQNKIGKDENIQYKIDDSPEWRKERIGRRRIIVKRSGILTGDILERQERLCTVMKDSEKRSDNLKSL